MSVETVIAGANTVLGTLTGIARVWPNAPESLADLPCTFIVPEKGTVVWPRKPNIRDITHDLKLTLVVSRGGDLPSSDQALKPWIDTIIKTFDSNITLQGSCIDAGVAEYTYGRVEYGGVLYLGIVFTVKAHELTGAVFHG